MPQFQQKVEILRREQIAPDIWRLSLYAPEIATAARPGQFVMVRVASGGAPLLRRPLSIHQADGEGILQLVFKAVGRGTELLSRFQAGDGLEILGPLGRGFRIACQGKSCLVGGGMGIVPLLFLAHWYQRECQGRRQPEVILGARNRGELEPFVAAFHTIGIEVQMATDDGSLGHHGLVTDLVRKIDLTPADTVYSCGPKPMMAALSQHCRNIGVPCQVSMETVMACGIGACLGCAVAAQEGGYVHVCSDGPVFDAGELIWTL